MKKKGIGGLVEEPKKEENTQIQGDIDLQDSNLNEIRQLKGPIGQMGHLTSEQPKSIAQPPVKPHQPE